MNGLPVYTSLSAEKSLWQEYRIYRDHVEFDLPAASMTIPFACIEGMEVSHTETGGMVRGEMRLKSFRPALKLDWVNFPEHVVMDAKEECIERIFFTPSIPNTFKKALETVMEQHRIHQKRK